ncbi:MAG: hypothetical protein V1681_06825 [Candidatus Neomarinimicrobiota bacterium]
MNNFPEFSKKPRARGFFIAGRSTEGQQGNRFSRSFFFKILLIFLLTGSPVFLVAENFEQQEQKVQQALRAMYNMEYKRAGDLFRTVMADTPFHPMGPLGVLAVQYYQNAEDIGFHRRNQQFLLDIEQTLQIYSRQIQHHPDRPEYLFFYGVVMGLKARILLVEKNYFGVLTSGLSAIKFIKKAEKLCPDEPDFHLPAGLFNYYVGISAPYFQIASRIMRESGSKEDGLKSIKADADHGNYGRWEARALLAYIYLYLESDYAGSFAYAAKLADIFSDNPYYAGLTADALIHLGEIDQARIYMKRVQNLLPTLKPRAVLEYQAKLQNLNGSLALAEGHLSEAETNLKLFFRDYAFELDYDFGNAYLQLGNVYDLQKRRPEAIACYRKVIDLNNRTTAVRLAKIYLQKPFSVKAH